MSPGRDDCLAALSFEAPVIHWRGPSPFFFMALPLACAAEVSSVARAVSYGWGMIPVSAAIGEVRFTTALFPKDGTYLLPVRAATRRQANITVGDRVRVELHVLNGSRTLR